MGVRFRSQQSGIWRSCREESSTPESGGPDPGPASALGGVWQAGCRHGTRADWFATLAGRHGSTGRAFWRPPGHHQSVSMCNKVGEVSLPQLQRDARTHACPVRFRAERELHGAGIRRRMRCASNRAWRRSFVHGATCRRSRSGRQVMMRRDGAGSWRTEPTDGKIELHVRRCGPSRIARPLASASPEVHDGRCHDAAEFQRA